MSNYVRVKLPGGCYFFTLVTFGRHKFLTSELARLILWRVWKEVQRKHPFNVEAICLLSDTCTAFGVCRKAMMIIPNDGG